MLFNSIDFAIVFPLHWILSQKLSPRFFFILASSYFFYSWWDWRFLILIVISSFAEFIIGKLINNTRSKEKKINVLSAKLNSDDI